ncbi:MAG: hypothetical protein IT455_03975 [Planctomycetes bacterium]|nr:hypothetical protein [Planctomycetota bacterium]
MEPTLVCLHLAAFLCLGLGLPLPGLRRPALILLAVAALASLGRGLFGEAAPLNTVHTYAGYQGSALEVSMVAFPTGTFAAPGWQWPLVYTGFAALWVVILLSLGRRAPKNALVLPLLFAWTATAAWLGMQWFAAPAALVQPVGLDRFLWPAGLAMALLAGKQAERFPVLLLTISAGTLLARLPSAVLSKYASDKELGTCLDVHTIQDIVNPMTQATFSPPLEVGSAAQQFWLIWLEHVIFFPAVYFLSFFGIAFGAYMFHQHGDKPR